MNPLQYFLALHLQFLPPGVLFDHNRQYSFRESHRPGMPGDIGADYFRPPADRPPSVEFIPEAESAEHLLEQFVQPNGLITHHL